MIAQEGWRGESKQEKGFFIATLVYLGFDVRKFNNEEKGIPFSPLLYDPKYTHVPPEKSPALPQASASSHSARNDFYRAKRKKFQLKLWVDILHVQMEGKRKIHSRAVLPWNNDDMDLSVYSSSLQFRLLTDPQSNNISSAPFWKLERFSLLLPLPKLKLLYAHRVCIRATWNPMHTNCMHGLVILH